MLGFYDGLIIWLAVWGVYWWAYVYILRPQGVSHGERYGLAAAYFLLAAASIVYLFADYFQELIGDFSWQPFFWLVPLLIFNLVVLRASSTARKLNISADRHHQFLAANGRYLVSKSAEIIFQQTLIVLLALILRDAGLGLNGVRLMFVIIFTATHLPLILIDGWEVGSFFVTAAAVASTLFPVMILAAPLGFVYSFALHQAFHVAAGPLFLFLWRGRRSLIIKD